MRAQCFRSWTNESPAISGLLRAGADRLEGTAVAPSETELVGAGAGAGVPLGGEGGEVAGAGRAVGRELSGPELTVVFVKLVRRLHCSSDEMLTTDQ